MSRHPDPARHRRAAVVNELEQQLAEADVLAWTVAHLIGAEANTAALALQVELLRQRIRHAARAVADIPIG